MSLWKTVPIFLISMSWVLSSVIHSKDPKDSLSSENWHRFKNSKYYIEKILEASFAKAQIFCKFHGMDLVSIENPEEDEFLQKVLEQERRNQSSWDSYWTSAHKLGEKWFWLGTGRYIDYFNWGSTESINFQGKNCINVLDKKWSVLWKEGDCNAAHYFICERNATYFERFCDEKSAVETV